MNCSRNNRPRRYYLLLGALVSLVVVFFSYMRGERLIRLDYRVVQGILPLVQRASETRSEIFLRRHGGLVTVSLANAAAVERTAKLLENLIHVILFALLAFVFLAVLRRLRYSLPVNLGVTGLVCSAAAYFSETVQQSISGRGYERIDVLNNFLGIAVGTGLFLLCLGLAWLIRGRPRAVRRDVPVVINRFLSAEPYMRHSGDSDDLPYIPFDTK